MASWVESSLRLLLEAKAKLAEHPRFKNVYYRALNAREFNDLYEHDRMLADRVRVEAYRWAIEKYVQPGQVVVDLGTGNGILALLAAGRDPARVYAIDHSPILETARQVAAANGIQTVTFVRTHSTAFAPPEKVDVIVHEQLGDALFNEDMIENVLDLRDRLLAPGGRILPHLFELFVEPVSLKEEFRVPFLWNQQIGPIDFGCVQKQRNELSRAYYAKLIRQYEVDALLCEPEPVLRCNLETMARDELPRRVGYERTAVREGWLDGFCVYFKAAFDDALWFETGPKSPRTHWGMLLLRVEPRVVRHGERLRFELSLDDLTDPKSWRWSEQRVAR